MTATREQEWQLWLDKCPFAVREVAKCFKPWLDYQFKDSKRLCTIHSFDEHDDGRVTLKVIQTDVIGFSTLVFGIDPNDIEPADEKCVRPSLKILRGL